MHRREERRRTFEDDERLLCEMPVPTGFDVAVVLDYFALRAAEPPFQQSSSSSIQADPARLAVLVEVAPAPRPPLDLAVLVRRVPDECGRRCNNR